MIYLEKFREEIEKSRIKLNLSKSDLARRISKSPSFICDIECGRKNPSLETALSIAKELGISMDKIIK